jgi:hypothetical protein
VTERRLRALIPLHAEAQLEAAARIIPGFIAIKERPPPIRNTKRLSIGSVGE